MTWNYRIVRHHNGGDIWFAIHEVYYEEDGKPKMVSTSPVAPHGENLDDLQKDLEMQKAACKLPILDYTLFNRRD